MRGDADGAHARAASAMRDAKRLVEVEVTDVRADVPRTAEAHLGIHVRPVHVHLPAAGVHRLAHPLDVLLEDTVGGGVRHHQRREAVLVLLRPHLQVLEVDVARGVGAHHNHLVAGHDRARGIGAVGAGRNEAHVAVPLAAGLVKGADDEEPGVFALAPGVGLKGDCGETGNLREPALEVTEELVVAGRLLRWTEGVEGAELRPSHRNHLRGGVELHGAAAQRNHRVGEAQVARLEVLQIAQHLRLGVVGIEDRMGEVGALAEQRHGQRLGQGRPQALHGEVQRLAGRQTPATAPRRRPVWWSRRG